MFSGWSESNDWETSEEVVAVIQVRKQGGPGMKTFELLERFKGQNYQLDSQVSGLSNWIDGGFRSQDGYSGKSSRFGKGKCWFGF